MDAHLVLVPRFGQAHDAIPGFAFNHAISQVTLGNDTLWLDTTDDVFRFGLLPPGDPGRKVLVIDGKTKVLTQLPPADPSRHRLQLQGRITCSGQIEALQTTLTATASGYPDYEFRTAARDTKEHRASLPLLAAKFRPAAGSFALEKQTATSVSALEEDFSWQAEGTCAGLVSEAGGKRVVHSPFWLPKEWDLALHHRHSPLFLNQGYPLRLDEEFEIGLPAKAQVTVLPPTSTHNEPPLQWKLEWSRVGDDKLSARFHAELAQGELSDPQTLSFQQQLRLLMSALGADAIVEPQP
jgi:hypothetical protein